MLPANLKRAAFLLLPAELPGCGRFWEVYERLDEGQVCHVRYLGALPPLEGGETTEALYDRAQARFFVEEA
jgi:hypothetical protein